MKRIGILGGLSAESTVSYYQHITQESIRRFGRPSYPETLIYSVNFDEYATWQHSGDWAKCAAHMIGSINALECAGADFIVIASNTMHTLIPELKPHINLPILDIVRCVGKKIQTAGLSKVALFGTEFSMAHSFYPQGLSAFGVECVTPAGEHRRAIHEIIYSELVNGIITKESRDAYIEAVHSVRESGAQAVIMGCTEIPLLLKPEDSPIPLFDSAVIHADAALDLAIGLDTLGNE